MIKWMRDLRALFGLGEEEVDVRRTSRKFTECGTKPLFTTVAPMAAFGQITLRHK
jgi:hypothetical protein